MSFLTSLWVTLCYWGVPKPTRFKDLPIIFLTPLCLPVILLNCFRVRDRKGGGGKERDRKGKGEREGERERRKKGEAEPVNE